MNKRFIILVHHSLIIILISFPNAFAATVDPIILSELSKIKEISKSLHNENSITQEIKATHNILAAEVNGFIDTAIIYVTKGENDSSKILELENKRNQLNRKTMELLKNMKETSTHQNMQKMTMPFSSLGSKLKANYGFIHELFVSGLNTFLDWIKQYSKDEEAKKLFIEKLNERKWRDIP